MSLPTPVCRPEASTLAMRRGGAARVSVPALAALYDDWTTRVSTGHEAAACSGPRVSVIRERMALGEYGPRWRSIR
jgi:hypothetical protein